MGDLEKMKNWLLSCPYLGTDTLQTEHTDPAPIGSGLYPMGTEVLEDREDVLGNRTQRLRYRFVLRQVVRANGVDADRLMRLQAWVQEGRGAPKFGEEPQRERIRAENGHLERASQTGTAMYTVTITADFIKKIRSKDHGKN